MAQPFRSVALARNLERERRVSQVAAALANLWEDREVVARFAAEWQVTTAQVWKLVREVRASWAEQSQRAALSHRDQYRQTWKRLFQRCWRAGDLKTCVAALTQLCKLDGAYAPELVEVSTAGEVHPDLVRERIRTLLARLPSYGTVAPEPPAVQGEETDTSPDALGSLRSVN